MISYIGNSKGIGEFITFFENIGSREKLVNLYGQLAADVYLHPEEYFFLAFFIKVEYTN